MRTASKILLMIACIWMSIYDNDKSKSQLNLVAPAVNLPLKKLPTKNNNVNVSAGLSSSQAIAIVHEKNRNVLDYKIR